MYFQRMKLDVETKQPKFEEMKALSSEFLKAGTHIMEPYRRLLERRWDNIQIKVRELEYALKSRKEERGEFFDFVNLTKDVLIYTCSEYSTSPRLRFALVDFETRTSAMR